MSRLFGHPAPLNSVRPGGEAHSALFAPRASFRLDLRRSLERHRRLALSIAIIGTLLAVVYLFRSWPNSGAVTIFVVMILLPIVLGIAAAIAAHKMDNKLYIASDVEQVLGFSPMAQWPDFDEIPEALADEHVLRFSAAVEYAHKQGGLNRCMFTGVTARTGTSTVAIRIADMLPALGQPTTLINSSVPDPSTSSVDGAVCKDSRIQSASLRNAASLSLLRQLAEEATTQDESLVIIDSAPLAISAETEYLARSVDCAIVVIQSGVTTRQQLRATANALKRLNVGSVGFLLNRISLSTADAAFKDSVRDMEEHLSYQKTNSGKHAMRIRRLAAPPPAQSAPAQSAPVEQQTVRVQPASESAQHSTAGRSTTPPAPGFAPAASERATAPPPPAASVPPPLRRTPAATPTPSVSTPPPPRSSTPAFQVTAVAAPSATPRPGIGMPAPKAFIDPAPTADSEVPGGLSESAWNQPDTSSAAPQKRTIAKPPEPEIGPIRPLEPEKVQATPREEDAPVTRLRQTEQSAISAREAEIAVLRRLEAELLAVRQREAAQLAEQMRRSQLAETPEASEPRLSGLRNVLFSLGLNNLNAARVAEIQQEPPLPPRQPRDRPQEPAGEYARTTASTVEPEVPIETPRVVTAAPEFLPPQPDRKDHHDRRDAYDEVEILPSWRGQYRRKG